MSSKVNVRLIGNKEFAEEIHAILNLFLDWQVSKAKCYPAKKPTEVRLYFTVSKTPKQ